MVEEKTTEDNKNNYFVYFILIGSLLVSGILIYKIIENKNIYKFGFITIENKPDFKFKDKINLFIVYDLNHTINNNILGAESVKLWVFLLHNFKNPVFYNIGEDCTIIYKNATSENKTRNYCLNIMKNLEYSVIILSDKNLKNNIKINNNKKQIYVYVDKENKDNLQNIFVFLKDLIFGKFKFD